jgi:hypothetical protein
MRVSIDNTTGLMIEMQSNPRVGTLIENALAAGFTDVSEREVTEQEYQDLLSAKNALLPKPPITVTPWQFRKALNQLTLREQVEQAVAVSTDQDLKDGWGFASSFVRNDPFVVSMGQALGKTDADMDQLFELAQTL